MGWPTSFQEACSGFGHGAAGISYSLTHLARRTGRRDFWAAATEGKAFEDLHYLEEEKNWLIALSRDKTMNAWCNGAAGIVLSRVEMLSYAESTDLEQDLEKALAKCAEDQKSHRFA